MATLPQDTNVYHVLERILQRVSEPMTCVELFDRPEVRAAATDVNKVSDALGNLYRRGYLFREPAPKSPRSQAKWAYSWKHAKKREPHPAVHDAMLTRAADAQPRPPDATIADLLNKPGIRISESGGKVVIDLPKLRITIESGG